MQPVPVLVSAVPRSHCAAQTLPDRASWERAWNSELDHLEATGALTFVLPSDVPVGTCLLPTKQFMALKTDKDGDPVRYKSRCIVRGDIQ